MNILFFLPSGFDPKKGGTEKVVDTLSKYFSRDGNSIFYVGIHSETDYEPPYPYLILDKYRLSSFNSVRIRVLESFVRNNKIDIIIDNYHHNKLKYIKMIAAVKKTTGVKVITLYHTSPKGHEFLWSRMGDNNTFSLPRKKRLKELVLTRNQIVNMERVKTMKALKYRIVHYDKIVLLSKRFFPEAIAMTGEETIHKYAAIPNPVGSLDEVPSKKEKHNELLWVGRMTYLKRPEKALKIWTDIQDQFPDWSINFLGDGELYEAMKQKSDSFAKRCHLLGFQDPTPYYQRSKIILLTSDFEGFVLVLVEAQRFGVVPISFENFASLPDIIQNGETGITIPTNNMAAYTAELSSLMMDEERIARISENAFLHSLHFAVENVVPLWYELFRSLGLSPKSLNDNNL